MRVSKLIEQLKAVQKEHGNIPVILDGACMGYEVDSDFRFPSIHKLDVQKMPILDVDCCNVSDREYKQVVLNPTKLPTDKDAA